MELRVAAEAWGVGRRRCPRVGWWNARALLAERRDDRVTKLAILRELRAQVDIALV